MPATLVHRVLFYISLALSFVLAVAMAAALPSVAAASTLPPHSIGYVGCSNSADAVGGYYLVMNVGLFWNPYSTGGGSLDRWANPSSQYWVNFDAQIRQYGQPIEVWIQICERATYPLTYSMVQQTFLILNQHAPSAKYYISPLNSYNPSNICSLTGPNGVADATALANEAVSNGLASAGPVLGPLTAQNTQSDLCHPNTAGEILLGGQLASFFDQSSSGSTVSSSSPSSSTASSSTSTSAGGLPSYPVYVAAGFIIIAVIVSVFFVRMRK
jgi:hypothetical protein